MTLQETFEATLTKVSDLFTRLQNGESVETAINAASAEYNTIAELMGATDRRDASYHAEDKAGEVWTVVTYRGGTYKFKGVLSRYQATHEAAKMAEEFVY